MNPSVFFRTLTIRCAKGRVPARKPALQRLCRTRGDILRFFSACGDLRAVFPIVAELANQIERASKEKSVFWRGLPQSGFKGALRVGGYAKKGGGMPGGFGQFRGGNGAWGKRRAAARAFKAFCNWKRPGRLGAISKILPDPASTT